MGKYFDCVNKNFGFGLMRLPMLGEEVDIELLKQMVDEFIAAGFTYFDTAHGYVSKKSEPAIREALTSRYPRDAYTLADKLSTYFFEKEEEIRPFFESQLKACGVTYFDFYLMHAQNADFYEKYKRCRAYEIGLELKREGKIKHFGISFHDKAAVLEQILTEQPEVEFVQIQFNYADYDDVVVEARKCYELCVKFGKPVVVMEPVRGGSLASLPEEADKIISALKGGSPASYAIRYAASFDGVMMVLSGMSNLEQLRENVSLMKDFKALNEEEFAAIDKVCKIFKSQNLIPCTACRYCTDGCPKSISIPDLFACMNSMKLFNNWNSNWYYNLHTQNRGKASDCIGCGKCESVCPQHLKIRELLKEVSAVFDK